jgi:phosphoribosyl 1,2-cyclic phosphodiesterase
MHSQALYIASLNSGSNGNCYYVGNEEEAVLIDAGLSCRETEKRMRTIGLNMGKVKALFISHEHTDHIKGMKGLAEKHAMPVYITSGTARRAQMNIPRTLLYGFEAHVPVHIGALQITAFPKFHDAADPHSFTISCISGCLQILVCRAIIWPLILVNAMLLF